MATLNDNEITSFNQGGVIEVGATPDVIASVVEGSMEIIEPAPEVFEQYDRETFVADMVKRKPRGMVRFRVRLTKNVAALRTALKPADTNGALTGVDVVVKIPDYRGASTGISATFSGCVVVGDITITENPTEFDEVTFELKHDANAPTWGTYGA